jgi:hypothetical protein
MLLAVASDLGNGSNSVGNAPSPLVGCRRYSQHLVHDVFDLIIGHHFASMFSKIHCTA